MTRTPTFTKSKETSGWPDPPGCGDPKKLSDADLADYIAACGYGYDGLTEGAREAIVRLLRKGSQDE